MACPGALRNASCQPFTQTLVEAIQHVAALPGMAFPLIACNIMDAVHAIAESETAGVRATCKTIEALLLAAPEAHQPSANQVIGQAQCWWSPS